MNDIYVLLVEDEKRHRQDFKNYVSTLKHPVTLYIADGESEGLKLVQKLSFNVIVLDLEFHESDGDGLGFLKKVQKLNLKENPYIIVTSRNNSQRTREAARENGADYIFWKGKTDYSPKLVMDFICDSFLPKTNADIKQDIVQSLTLEDDIRLRIGKIGVNDDMLGRKYAVDAISIVTRSNKADISLHKDVYPIIARKYRKSTDSVIKAIESAINKAWNITDESILIENYTAVVSGSKGAPTNREFIFYFASQVKQ